MPTDYPEAGKALQRWLDVKHWSHDTLAREIRDQLGLEKGIDRRTVTLWASGQSWPREPEWRKALRKLGGPVDEIEADFRRRWDVEPDDLTPSERKLLAKWKMDDDFTNKVRELWKELFSESLR